MLEDSACARRRVAGMATAIATLACVGPAPVAADTVIASSVRGYAGPPAMAADGRVVVGEQRGNGALGIVAIDPATGRRTELLAVPPLANARHWRLLTLAGTGGIVTATLDTFRPPHDYYNPMAGYPDPVALRALEVLPAIVPIATCHPGSLELGALDAAGGDAFVASVGEDCPPRAGAVRITGPAGAVAIAATPARGDRLQAPLISRLRAAGPMAAWLETVFGGNDDAQRAIVVARAATGEVLLRVEDLHTRPETPASVQPVQFGLGADGTIAFESAEPCSLLVASPASRAPRALQLPQGLCPSGSGYGLPGRELGRIAIAAGRFVYPTDPGYAVTDLRGAARALGDPATRSRLRSPPAFDGRTLVAVRSDCDADRLVALDADAPPAASPSPPPPDPGCPVQRGGPGTLRVTDDGRVRIVLRCTEGCLGTLRLVQAGRTEGMFWRSVERTVASARFDGPGPEVTVRMRVARYARALAGCPGGLRVHALRFGRAGLPAKFGTYRIRSRSACRRRGGPRLGPRQAPPRP